MDYAVAMERRVGALEEALLGDARPGGQAGLIEVQRAQGNDIRALRNAVDGVGRKVDDIIKKSNDESKVREGEQRMLRLFRNIIFALLAIGAGGGSLMAKRVLDALSQLTG